MNRFEKKCLLGSAALHGLLAVVFLFGSAFFTPKPRKDPLPVINFIPDVLVDKELFGGGDPKVDPRAQPPPPPPPAQQEVKPPPPQPDPPKQEPPKKEVKSKPPETKQDDLLAQKPKPREAAPTNTVPKVNTTLTTRRNPEFDKKKMADDQNRRVQEQRIANLSQKLDTVSKSLTRGLTTSTLVGTPGPGGLAFANYGQFVKSVYDAAWQVPEDMDDTDSTVKARITIARDGSIRSAYIVSRSPNGVLNRSVQRALDDVKTIGKPFPEGAREDQRVFEINFNLKARRQQLG